MGTLLSLQWDLENRYVTDCGSDFDDKETEGEYSFSYIPRVENDTIATILEMEGGDLFECSISKVNLEAHLNTRYT